MAAFDRVLSGIPQMDEKPDLIVLIDPVNYYNMPYKESLT